MGNNSSNNKKIEDTFKNVGNTIKKGVVDTAKKIEVGSKQTLNTVKAGTLNVVKKVEVGSTQTINTVKAGTLNVVKKVEVGSKQVVNTVKVGTINTVKKVEAEVKKPAFIQGLQQATKIATGIIAITPIGKLAVKAITLSTGAAGKGGDAAQWMGGGNSTLSMVPGGMLAQSIASAATNGRSDQVLQSTLPDPKKMLIKDAISVGKTTIQNPKQTVNVIKTVAKQNVNQVSNTTIAKVVVKPIQAVVKPVQQTLKALPAKTLTINNSIKPSLLTVQNNGKVDLLASMRKAAPIVQNTLKISPPHIPSVITSIPKKIESTLAIHLPVLPKPSLIPQKVDVVVKQAVNTLGIPSETKAVPIPIKSTIQIPTTTQPAKITEPTQTPITTLVKPIIAESTLVKTQPENQIIVSSKQFNLIEWLLDLLRGL